jgi:hypothetical protein
MLMSSTISLSIWVQILVALSAELIESIEISLLSLPSAWKHHCIPAPAESRTPSRMRSNSLSHPQQPSLGAIMISNSHLMRSDICITDLLHFFHLMELGSKGELNMID